MLKRFCKTNILKEKHKAATYRFYDKNKRLIYAGSSVDAEKRLEAPYYKRSDYATVRGKGIMADKTKYYHVHYCKIKQARMEEDEAKKELRYNKSKVRR